MLKVIKHGAITEIKAYRTFLGRPVYHACFFYVDGLLIDTGPPHLARDVAGALNLLPVKQVVVTHEHEDHYGNCQILREQLGVPVYAHPLTLETMAHPPRIQLYRKFMWGAAPPAEGEPLGRLIATPRFRFRVIHTPGHSPGHVSLFEPTQRWLFCGDLYLGEKLTAFMEGENILEHLSSLEKAIALAPDILYCGLKGRLENATACLRGKYDYWQQLGMKVKELHEEGNSPQLIRRSLFGGEIPFYYLSQLNWGHRHLIDSFIEHAQIF